MGTKSPIYSTTYSIRGPTILDNEGGYHYKYLYKLDFWCVNDHGTTEFNGVRTWSCIGFRPILDLNELIKTLSLIGGICWFRYGHSDSESFSGEEEWSYIWAEGIKKEKLIFR